ncbi:hypothetical protein GCM10018987_19250 [Streptomyces cremeus]
MLGRPALPGRQRTGIPWTIGVGIVAALAGTAIAAGVGVSDTKGIDWIELAVRIARAAAGVAAVERLKGRRRPTNATRLGRPASGRAAEASLLLTTAGWRP